MTSTPPLSVILTDASAYEQGAMIYDRSGDIHLAVAEYAKAVASLTEALSFMPLNHPDCSAIEQHTVEIQSRISYLSSLPMNCRPSVPLESHISPVQLSVTSSRSSVGPGKTMGVAATIGGLGGMLLLGPLGLIAGAAGAAYATTRDDQIGSTTRDVAKTSVHAFDKVAEVDREHNISGRAKELGSSALSKAVEFNEKHQVTEKVKTASETAVRRMSEMNEKYKITDTIASGISAGISTISNFWANNAPSSTERVQPPPPHQQYPQGGF